MKTVNELVASAKKEIVQIGINEFTALVDSAALIIDVREPGEFSTGSIRNALNIPRGLLEFKINDILASGSEATIGVLCRSGARAALAAQTLATMGYTDVRSLEGGLEAWIKDGGEIEVARS
ncbi:rhodanese-related sulfurtransferase [Oxalobacteraceae bacterium GrIS 2.11]